MKPYHLLFVQMGERNLPLNLNAPAFMRTRVLSGFADIIEELQKNNYEVVVIDGNTNFSQIVDVCTKILKIEIPVAIVAITYGEQDIKSLLELGVEEVVGFDEDIQYRLPRIIELAVARSTRAKNYIKRLEERERATSFDPITDLPNRHVFLDQLNRTIRVSAAENQKFAIMSCDLDHFITVNETIGPENGDEILRQFGKRLQKILPKETALCRIDGDEFCVILQNIKNAEEPGSIAYNILDAMKTPFMIDDKECYLTVSIGIALYPEDGDKADTLIQSSISAVRKAKELGRNHYRYFAVGMNSRVVRLYHLSNQLRKAWTKDEFTLYYQPVIDTQTNRVCRVEALIRWLHPELGIVPPNDFIPLMEEMSLINTLSEWVMKHAIEQHIKWRSCGMGKIPIAINMSATQIYQPNFLENLNFYLRHYNMEPSQLEIEVTEGALMKDPEKVMSVLNSVRRLGVHIALDDFGTGYSSLSHLQHFPINVLKIDKMFIDNILESAADTGIVQAILLMGKSSGKDVVCEGVESRAQCDKLKELGCTLFQGYYFCKPEKAEDVELFIKQYHK